MRKLPFDKAKLEEIAAKWPTPFHVYDAKAIKANAKRLKKAFAWNTGFREYFAVKAAPNPHLMKLLKEFDFGSDCSSMAELVLAEKVGNVGDKIMFTSNDTPAEEFVKAAELGAIINFDDVTHWDFFRSSTSTLNFNYPIPPSHHPRYRHNWYPRCRSYRRFSAPPPWDRPKGMPRVQRVSEVHTAPCSVPPARVP